MNSRNPLARAVRRLRPQAVPDKRADVESRHALAETRLGLLDSLAESDASLLGAGLSHTEEKLPST
jgi:hypothetical protein